MENDSDTEFRVKIEPGITGIMVVLYCGPWKRDIIRVGKPGRLARLLGDTVERRLSRAVRKMVKYRDELNSMRDYQIDPRVLSEMNDLVRK